MGVKKSSLNLNNFMSNDILLNEILKSTDVTSPNITSSEQSKENIDDLIKDISDPVEPVKLPPIMELKEENTEEFIRNNAGQLVQEGLDYVRQLKAERGNNVSYKEIESIAEMIKATASAIESLNKISIVKLKNESKEKLKQLEKETENKLQLSVTRDQLFDMMIKYNESKKDNKQLDDTIIDINQE